MDVQPSTGHSRGVSETAAAPPDAATAAVAAETDTALAVGPATVRPTAPPPDLPPEPAPSVTPAAATAGVAGFSADAEAELCARVLGDRKHGF